MNKYRWNTYIFYQEDGGEGEVHYIDEEVRAETRTEAEEVLLKSIKDNGDEFVAWATGDGKRIPRPVWQVWRRATFDDLSWAVDRVERARAQYFILENTTPGSGEALLTETQTRLNDIVSSWTSGEDIPLPNAPGGQMFWLAVEAHRYSQKMAGVFLENDDPTGQFLKTVRGLT